MPVFGCQKQYLIFIFRRIVYMLRDHYHLIYFRRKYMGEVDAKKLFLETFAAIKHFVFGAEKT